jgi:hypothetical protein
VVTLFQATAEKAGEARAEVQELRRQAATAQQLGGQVHELQAELEHMRAELHRRDGEAPFAAL